MAATQPLHTKTRTLIEESKKLLAQYQHLAQQQFESSQLDELSRRFEVDRKQVKLAIAAGRRVAGAEINDMLADKTREFRGRQLLAADDETLGGEVLLIGKKQRLSQDLELGSAAAGWGTVASKTAKAVKKLHQASAMEE